MSIRQRLRCFGAAAFALTLCTLLPAQTAYKYRDANGQWVFTDNAPAAAARADSSFSLDHENEALRLTIERSDSEHTTQLIAVNDCICIATFALKILHSEDPEIPHDSEYREILQPKSRKMLVSVENAGRNKTGLRYMAMMVPGSPEAKHKPPRPYRAPFAIGSTYVVSQAYPSKFTHTSPDSQYAVDIALPDGTPVYAAREGIVINIRHDGFRGGLSPVMMDQANVVEILHDDGTIALYAHLHWDSIRVRIGQHVGVGEYLANSGSTGFSSGPHLHFAVVKNDNFTAVSVPIEFAGPSATAVTPVTQKSLTAY